MDKTQRLGILEHMVRVGSTML